MDFDRRIIVAVLADEATEFERAAMASWRAAAPENDATFLRQSLLWDLLGSLSAVDEDRMYTDPGERVAS